MQDKFTDVLASILLKVYDPNIKILKVIGCIISLWPLMSVIWFICWSVGWFDLSVCHNFLKVTLPCAFLCTYVCTYFVNQDLCCTLLWVSMLETVYAYFLSQKTSRQRRARKSFSGDFYLFPSSHPYKYILKLFSLS